MRFHLFTTTPSDGYPVAILIKPTAFTKHELQKAYVNPLVARGIAAEDIIAFTLRYDDVKKVSNATIKTYLDELLPELTSQGSKTLFVMDGNYFKVLTGSKKAEVHLGYVLPCTMKGYEHLQVALGVNWQSILYDPNNQAKLDLALHAVGSHMAGQYEAIGQDIIHSAWYPEDLRSIQEALNSLHQYPYLSCDTETFSLRFNESGIGSVAFAWDEHNGIAFAVDYQSYPEKTEQGYVGYQARNPAVRAMLKEFLTTYQGELRFHNASFDLKILIHALWMQDLQDQVGLLEGLDILYAKSACTKIIAYLATNSTAGNELGLKALAHSFAGNYAKAEINDIRKIPKAELLKYNLIDCLCTNHVHAKYYPRMVADQQEELYKTLLFPSQKLLTHMELTGLPVSIAKLQEVKAKLVTIGDRHLQFLRQQPLVQEMDLWVQKREQAKANEGLKTFCKLLVCFDQFKFNPGSPQQTQVLLYEKMGLPVLDYTDTKQPATGNDSLKKLVHHCKDPNHAAILEAIMGWSDANKILTTFIPAFEKGIRKADDGTIWVHGNFNMGGTVSGRLSSSDPNLTNIPAGSVYGKLIKECFVTPEGLVFAGADYASLEDYVSALTTKDKNKLDVYLRGFDGHCLRAAYYFRDQVPHIDLSDPASVNTLKKTHPHLRQDSKAPTFLLTYGGTYHGMMSNLGWDKEKSQLIEANYHELYKESDAYVQAKIAQASKDGYVTVAFGLRVRTPLLKQVIYGSKSMPYEAAAEARTAGNALGQSYCMLTMRAMVDFMQKVWDSPYRYDIQPAAIIHDANYLIIKDDIAVVEWANRELIKSMEWQELPEIQHDQVKINAQLDVFYNGWHQPITLPINASQEQIITTCAKGQEKYLNAQQEKLKEAA